MPVSRFIPASSRSTPAPAPEPEPDPDAIDAAALAAILDVDETTAERLLAAASALVERYAPDAPQAVKNEALIRCAGWLSDAPADGTRGHTAGPFSIENSPSMTSALRHSGAMALLSPWKVRRAGVIA